MDTTDMKELDMLKKMKGFLKKGFQSENDWLQQTGEFRSSSLELIQSYVLVANRIDELEKNNNKPKAP